MSKTLSGCMQEHDRVIDIWKRMVNIGNTPNLGGEGREAYSSEQ